MPAEVRRQCPDWREYLCVFFSFSLFMLLCLYFSCCQHHKTNSMSLIHLSRCSTPTSSASSAPISLGTWSNVFVVGVPSWHTVTQSYTHQQIVKLHVTCLTAMTGVLHKMPYVLQWANNNCQFFCFISTLLNSHFRSRMVSECLTQANLWWSLQQKFFVGWMCAT